MQWLSQINNIAISIKTFYWLPRVQDLIDKLTSTSGVDWYENLGLLQRKEIGNWEPVVTSVRVDRSKKMSYPAWAKQLDNPELENQGPSEYDLYQIELWSHPRQSAGESTSGESIHDAR